MPEEGRGHLRMYRFKQLKDWFQNCKRCTIRINHQVKCPFWPSLIRVVNESVPEGKIQVKSPVNCRPAMFAYPAIESHGQVLGCISSASLPMRNGRDSGLHQDLG